MNKMSQVFCKVILVILAFPVAACAEAEHKIAIVDVEAVLERSVAVENIKKSINSISEKMQADLSAKEAELKATESELIKQRGILPEEDFNQKVADFNKKVSLIQQDMQTKKSSIERAHNAALSEVHKNILSIISELSKKYGIDVVLPSAQVLYAEDSLNITLEVIGLLNNRLKEVKVVF